MIWHENKPMIDYKNIIKQKGITIPHCKSMGIATRKTNCHKNARWKTTTNKKKKAKHDYFRIPPFVGMRRLERPTPTSRT